MKQKLNIITLIILALVIPLVPACNTTIEQGGVYSGDKFLYQTDKTISDTYDALHAFVKWEYDNHAVVSEYWPDVTKTADDIRSQTPVWLAACFAARSDYLAARDLLGKTNNPAIGNPSELVAEAQQKLIEALSKMRTGLTNAAASKTTLSNQPTLIH